MGILPGRKYLKMSLAPYTSLYEALVSSYDMTQVFLQPGLRKQMIASEVMDSFNSHQLVTVFHYNDVTCQEWKKFRNKLSKYEIKLKVIPVRLSARVSMCKYCDEIVLDYA